MRKVTFLLVGANTDVHISSNFIRSYQMNTYWVKKVLHATFGNPSLEPVKLSFDTKDSRKGYVQPLDCLRKKNKDKEDIEQQHKPTLPPPPYFTQGPPPEDYDVTTTEDSAKKQEQTDKKTRTRQKDPCLSQKKVLVSFTCFTIPIILFIFIVTVTMLWAQISIFKLKALNNQTHNETLNCVSSTFYHN
jgi:hypothetical protein